MKAILEFNLPEDQDQYSYAHKGHVALNALSNIASDLRERLKHREPNTEHKTPAGAVESIRERFYQILEELDINLDRDFS